MNLTNINFENHTFQDVDFNDADFTGSTLKNVRFINCTGAKFGKVKYPVISYLKDGEVWLVYGCMNNKAQWFLDNKYTMQETRKIERSTLDLMEQFVKECINYYEA